ncbi:dentin sialophosphoprotein-like [Macrobrachium rosenbergii]|uniref:dentin sialophosphoprotein-like n=1 Tax=Macrobrachium rosenbergii TaxID=79674 RepID=UPI0034D433CF
MAPYNNTLVSMKKQQQQMPITMFLKPMKKDLPKPPKSPEEVPLQAPEEVPEEAPEEGEEVNEPSEDPGYGQSILQEGQSVFHLGAYSELSHSHYDSHSGTSKDRCALSSGYIKSASPATPADFMRASSSLHHGTNLHASDKLNPRHNYQREVSVTSHDSDPLVMESEVRGTSGPMDPNTLRSGGKDVVLGVPGTADNLSTPGSLSDLRRSVDNVSSTRQSKMPSSLSLQTELPLHASNNHRLSVTGMRESNSRQSLSSQHSLLTSVQRTVSVGSETQSEAFFSADEDQMTIVGNGDGSLSRVSSQQSLPVVPEDQQQMTPCNEFIPSEAFSSSPHHDQSYTAVGYPERHGAEDNHKNAHSRSRSRNSSSSSTQSNSSCSSSGHSASLDHSQASLLHSGAYDSSRASENEHLLRSKKKRVQPAVDCSGDSSSEVVSVSSTSFISAVSSQEDIALVDLHMQLNKPITDSPLLMSSYVNHMTQVSKKSLSCFLSSSIVPF